MKALLPVSFACAALALMAMLSSCESLCPWKWCDNGGSPKIETKLVEYTLEGVTMEGFLAWDASREGKRPGVLVVHAWKGLDEHARTSARRLAELGYVAFAADIYGKGVRPATDGDAAKEAGKYRNDDRSLLRARARAALDTLAYQDNVDASKLGAIGYCFGGSAVLELALSGASVDGTVSFHGGLQTPKLADAKNITGEVLILHGADDPFAPQDHAASWEDALKKAGKSHKVVMYPGAVHSFTDHDAGNDPSKGAAYNEAADKASWEEMRAFFERVLG